MDSLIQDVRFAARQLRRRPGFTAVAVLTVALGIGVTTAVFSVVNALLIRPLPVESPEELVRLHKALRNPGDGSVSYTTWSYPDYAHYAEREDLFRGVVARHFFGMVLHGADGELAQLRGHAVSGNYFEVLGIRAVHGRTLLPSDDQAEDPGLVAVLSREAWQQYFHADPSVIGSTVTLSGQPFTIAGVIGSEPVFRAIGEPEVWIPIHTRALLQPGMNPLDTRNVSFIPEVVARLRPGVTVEEARAQVEVIGQQLAEAYPESNANRFAVVMPAGTLHGFAHGVERAETLRFASLLLLAVVAIILLIVCANVANLLLVRAVGRAHELVIRSALGAGRGRIAGQLLTESVLLALLGGAGGVLLGYGGVALARHVPDVAQLSPTLDGRVLSVALFTAMATGILFGLAPALLGRDADAGHTLRSARTATRRRLGLQRALIVGQIGLALVLVVASGLVLRTLKNLTDVDPGFEFQRILLADVMLPAAAMEDPERQAAAVRELLDEVRALPGVVGAGFSTVPPLTGGRLIWTIEVPGYEPTPGESMTADFMTVDDDYFSTLGTPLLHGRSFSALPPGMTDGVLVNEAMVERFWRDREAVGQWFALGSDTVEVVGVVADIRHLAIPEAPVPTIFLQHPRQFHGYLALHIRTEGDPAALMAPVRRLVQTAAPGRPPPRMRLMPELARESISEARIAAAFFTLLGGLALLLAAVGLYGVLAYSVAQRAREIGIRMALGATVTRVTGRVLREGAMLVAAGAVLGLGTAYATSRLIQGVLYGLEPQDSATFLGSGLVLGAVSLLAAYLPARRAARVDPTIALKSE